MARFPDPTSLQRRQSRAQAPVGSVRNAGAEGDALSLVGETVRRETLERQQRKSNFEYSTAKAKFLAEKAKLDNSLRDDPDYGTFVDRYGQQANDLRDEVAMGISDPTIRDAFIAEQDVRIAEGTERISNLARRKEIDAMQSQVTEQLLGLRDVVITGGDPETVASAQGLIDSAVENGYFTQVQGTQLIEKWKEESAVGWLDSIEPEKRVEALKSPMADNLPTARRADLTRKAETELNKFKAKGMVDEWVAQGVDRESRLKQMESIKDPDLYDEVLRRSDNQINQDNKAELERQSEIYQSIFPLIRSGEVTLDEFDDEQLNSLTPAMVNNLYSAEAQASKTIATRSDRQLVTQLQALAATENYGEMLTLVMEQGARLSDADYEQYSQIAVNGEAPIEYKSFQMAKNRLVSKMQAVSGDEKTQHSEHALLNEKLSDWHRQYWEMSERKKLPTDREVEDKIDQLLMETTVPVDWIPDRDKPLYQLTSEEIQRTVNEMKSTNPTLFDQVLGVVGESADPLDFIEAYEYAARSGN